MKYLKAAVLFSVLVFFPAISWYYLQSGLDFRKEMYSELQSDGRSITDIIGSDELNNKLANKTTLLVLDDRYKEAFSEIDDQFRDSYTYQMIYDTAADIKDSNGFAMLIDTAGIVRYEYSDPDNMKRVVQHLSLVIPKLPEKDIVIKR